MNRFFLSWDKPACRAVAERLLSLEMTSTGIWCWFPHGNPGDS